MRWSAILFVLLLVLPTAVQGQATDGPDVQLADLRAHGEPLVETATKVSATINNPSSVDAIVDVRATFADGSTANPHDTLGFQVRVPAQGKKVVDLSIFSPASKRGQQTLTVRVDSPRDPRPDDNAKTIGWFVRDPRLKVTAEVVKAPEVPVSGVGFVRFRVTNEGNIADAPIYHAAVKSPWRADIKPAHAAIDPGQSQDVLLLLRPNSEDAAAETDVVFSARSIHSKAMNVSAIVERVVANASHLRAAHRTAIEGLPASLQVIENESARIPFAIANRGATPDVLEVALGPVTNATGWAFGLLRDNRSVANVLVGLAPGRSLNLTLLVTRLAADVSPATVTLRAGSLNAGLFGTTGAEVNVTRLLNVTRAEPVIRIATLDAPTLVYRGERVTAKLDIENVGRIAAPAVAVRWELRELGRLIASAEESIEAPPGPARAVWSFTMDRMEGEYLVSAEILSGVLVKGPSKISKSLTLHLPRLEIVAPATIELNPGTRVNLVTSEGGFAVRNLGKVDERITATLTSSASWLARSWEVVVPARGQMVLPFSGDVPAMPGAPAFKAELEARLAGREFAPIAANLTFLVRDQSPPEVRLVAPAGEMPHTKSVAIDVEARDPIGVRDVEALVVGPDGERDLIRLAAAGGDRYKGTFAVRLAGLHVLEIRARDRAEPPHVRTLSNATFIVLAPPYAGVVPRGWGNHTTIHARVLAFDEVEEGTTRNLTVDVGFGPRLVPYPYRLEVPGWDDGVHTVVVRAVGHGGGVRESRYTVTLDSRAPALSDASVQTTEDGGIALAVRAERATSVKARLVSPSGTFEVILEKDGDLYTARAAAPSAWSEVTFIAESGAGTESVSVAHRDPGASRTPHPGFAALLAAAGLGARLRRRSAIETSL
ncbi:MAG TPA: hypothetical protein VM889_10375 [Candidatus Thermoplasmatota archaeon]|nr:hypothetical protein [Candidatus Thermoplasmatota archaeon]